MRKWEERYEKLKNGEFDSKIDELKSKISENKATREEYKEYEKLVKCKDNVGKVTNIIEFKERTQEYLNELKKEIQTRENAKKASQESIKIEVELIQIEKDLEDINNKLKNKGLTPEEKSKLEDRKATVLANRDNNNKKYMDNQAVLKEGLNKNEKFKNYDDNQLEELKLKTSSRISKCNMVANSLVNGLSWDSIDLKLDNWGKLTNKGEKLSRREKDQDKTNEKEQPESKVEETVAINDKTENKELRTKLGKQAEFAEKHPRLAKIGNWFKKLFKQEALLPEKTTIEEQAKSEAKEEVENDSDKEFKEYIKQIAEKGINGLEAEQKATRQQAAKEKLEQMRAANRATEAKKFGQEYANKSDYRTRNDDEGR